MSVNVTFDTTNDGHVAWFSAIVARTTDDPHSGAGCLSWTATDGFSGVEVVQPGFTHGMGAGTLVRPSLWVKGKSGAYDTSIGWTIKWTNEVNADLGSEPYTVLPVTSEWAQFVYPTDIDVPAGATRVHWQLDTNSAGVGSVILLDDIAIVEPPSPGTFHWVSDESGLLLPASPLGWWDGSAVQPMTQKSP